VIEKTIAAFQSCGYIDEIIVAARREDISEIREIVKAANLSKVINIVGGGGTRFESVSNAVDIIGAHIDFIAVHDGARCFITCADIEKVALRAFETGAAAAGSKITDTIKRADPENNITATIDREALWAAQTPQIFRKDLYAGALKNCGANLKNLKNLTDDCAVAESAGYPVSIVECSRYNIKITDAQDLIFFDFFDFFDSFDFLNISERRGEYKTGHGYDVHRFAAGRRLILGGVEIPNDNTGLDGHSDADVLIHAVTDALLGAAGLGDIGEYFPDSDERYKNISSAVLLEKTAGLISKDYIISNIDCTVILEKPKLAQYKSAIREKLGGILGICHSDINIKAKTEEGLGFTGAGQGIAAHVVCLLHGKNYYFSAELI
jgi:2-C-methyl-D-erythritol 4-phosphate cytidylyltransferase/2-C-methyl-D-erythritol 2,4-cyclodiphosphate synthase